MNDDRNDTLTEEERALEKEAQDRWGDTPEYQESQRRVHAMTPKDMARIKEESLALLRALAALMPLGPSHPEVADQIAKHYAALRSFYEPTPELYRGLAELYITDPRFTAHFETVAPGLALFMHDAMLSWITKHQ